MATFSTSIVIGGRLNPSLQRAFTAVGSYASKAASVMAKANDKIAQSNAKMTQRMASLKNIPATIAGIGSAVGAGMLGKTMLDQASSMEQYRNTLNVVMKDSKKAGDMFQWANNFANATPFDTDEVVEGTVKLQAYGLEAKKTLPMVGDMSAVMGKSLDEGVEAIADAQTGELERLKEFGITKNMIDKQAKSMGFNVINNKGQITDVNRFNQALMALMKIRFGGGMQQQSKTFKGAMSNLSGTFKTTLAQIAGVTSRGDIIKGSLFDVLTKSAVKAGDILGNLANSGITTKIGSMFGNMATVAGKLMGVFKFLKDNSEILIPVLGGVGSALMALKIASYIPKVLEFAGAVKKVIAVFQFASLTGAGFGSAISTLLGPVGIAVVAIGLLVAAGIFLYRNWDTIKEKAQQVGSFIANVWSRVWGKAKSIFSSFGSWIKGFFSKWGIDILMAIAPFIAIPILIIKHWDKIRGSISQILSSVWNVIVTVFTAIASVVMVVLSPIIKVISVVFNIISTIIEAVLKLILAVVIIVFYNIYTVVSGILTSVWSFITTVWNSILAFITPIITAIWSVITTIWTSIYTIIVTVLTTIWSLIVTIWTGIYSTISPIIMAIWNVITTIWTAIYTTVVGILTSIWGFITGVWNSIYGTVSGVISGIVGTISGGFSTAYSVVVGIFTGMKNTVLAVFQGIWSGVKAIINTGIGMINGFIGGVNKVIGVANKVPGVNIGSVGTIPALAKGGITTGPSIAGEAGQEAVIPLKRNNPRSISLLSKTAGILGVGQIKAKKAGSISHGSGGASGGNGEKTPFYIVYSPKIYTSDNEKTDIKKQLDESFEKFKQWYEQIKHDEERLDYGS
ncbi:tape measure protein [Clostridium tyrobutyricum]|uniref:tape measure protein n=1 Tax=Clostridium tyrobutyricum TaxID=1519 RepID=UPI00073D2BE6|nr:tape measure protein [Clostridium tyrobutyricum]